jgi:hypothetical protein
VHHGREPVTDDERRDDGPPELDPALLRILVLEDVQRPEVDPVLAKELLGRGTGRSAGAPDERDVRHRGD